MVWPRIWTRNTVKWIAARETGRDGLDAPNSDSHPRRPKAGRSMTVRKAAAQAAVTASKKTGRPVDERVKKIADAR
jgi:hypothetical protein